MFSRALLSTNKQFYFRTNASICSSFVCDRSNVRIRNYSISNVVNNVKFLLVNSGVRSVALAKNYCVQCDDPNIATYEEVKDLGKHPEKLLIDVREPEELQETGKIPYSINIPLGDVVKYLSFETPNNEFLEMFGREKPSNKTPVIFYCKIGKRSQQASDIARQLGFQNVKNYKGSWLDWAEREGLPK